MPGSPISVTSMGNQSPSLADKRQVRDAKEKQLGSQMASLMVPSKPIGQSGIHTKIDPVKEKLIQTIALMEYQAKEALNERVSDCPAADLFGELPDLREHMQSLDLLKTLQVELDKQEKLVRELEYKVSSEGINAEVAKAKKQAEELQEQVKEMEKEKNIAQGDLRIEHNKLIEAKRMCEFMQSRIAKVTDEKKEIENDLNIQINKLNFQLTNAKMISTFLEQKLKETKKQKEESELEASKVASNLKFQLTNAKSISDFVQSKLKDSQEKVKELEAKIAKLEFSLTNSKSIGQFMEGKLVQTQKDNKSLQEKVAQLESEIGSLNIRLALKNDLIEKKDQRYKEQVATTEQVEKELVKYKGKLNAANKMTAFLQSQLAEAEEEHFSSSYEAAASNPLQEQVKSLKSNLEQSQKRCDSLKNQLALVQDEKYVTEERIRDLEAKLQSADSKIDGMRQSKYQDKTAELQSQVRDLTRKLKEAEEAVRNAESRASNLQDQPIGGNAHDALLDLEFRLTQSEVANKSLQSEMVSLKQAKEEADAKIQELERRLQKSY